MENVITMDKMIGLLFCLPSSLLFFKTPKIQGMSSPCNGNHFCSDNWASEASPTLGCSIEISHDIYIFMCLSWSKMRTQNYVAKHAHAQGQVGAVKTDQ